MTQVPFHDYPGLDLRASVDTSACIDLLNVDLDVRGVVRSRDGFDNFSASASVSRFDGLSPFYRSNGSRQLLASSGVGQFYTAYDTSGAPIASQATGVTFEQASFVRFGGPSAEVAYTYSLVPTPIDSTAVYKWDGATWSAAAGVRLGGAGYYPFAMDVSSTDNRLVGAFPNSQGSRVGFSNAGVPETWDATNFVDVTPGDGERITALVSWRELVFVFKETKFFVFTGTSTSGTGTPVFNYRPVACGVGALGRGCVTTSPSGVYFLSRRGIYRTTGNDPTLVSRAIDPIFRGGESAFYLGGTLNHAAINKCSLAWHDERLYFAFPSGSSTVNNRVLVFDPEGDYWVIWDIPAADLTSFRIGDLAELLFSYSTGSNHIGRLAAAYTDDDGTPIASRYRTGFYDMSIEEEKTINRAMVWGWGEVDYSLSRNFGALGTASTLTLGTNPAIARADVTLGETGSVFSHQFQASAPWRIYRFTQDQQGTRTETTKT